MALPSFASAFSSSVSAPDSGCGNGENSAAAAETEGATTTTVAGLLPLTPPFYALDGEGGGGGSSSRSEPDSDFEYDFPNGDFAFHSEGPPPRLPQPSTTFLTTCSPSPPPPSLSPVSSQGSLSEDEGLGGLNANFRQNLTNDNNANNSFKKRHACHACSRNFPHASQLEEHILYRHSDVRKHSCSHCGKSFKTKSNLNQHLRTHLGASVSCPICSRQFTASGLRYHLLSAHGPQEQKQRHVCDQCGKSFLQNKLLQKHMRSRHSSERRFKCAHCPAAFKRKDHLDRHSADSHCAVRAAAAAAAAAAANGLMGCEERFGPERRLKEHGRQVPQSSSSDSHFLHEFGDSVTDAALDAFIRAIMADDQPVSLLS